jgi:hypothetical protein
MDYRLSIGPARKRGHNIRDRKHNETQHPQRNDGSPTRSSWLGDAIPKEKESPSMQGERSCIQRINHHGLDQNRFRQIDCKKHQHPLDNQNSNTNAESHSFLPSYLTIESNQKATSKTGDANQEIHSISIGKQIDERTKKVRQKSFYLIVIGIALGSLITPFNHYLGGFLACSLISGGFGMQLASYDLSL